MERKMRSLIGDIQQPRRIALPHIGQKIEGVICEGVGSEELPRLIRPLRCSNRQADHRSLIPRIDAVATREAIEVVETTVDWRNAVAPLPFANHVRSIARCFEHLGECDTVWLQESAVAGLILIAGHVANAGLMRVE